MRRKAENMLLVGDNPFQGVSHLTQERERTRNKAIIHPEHAAELIGISLNNGANGFMFSLNENTLSILKKLREKQQGINMSLYPTVPSAYEYVRLSSRSGMTGLVMHVARQVVISGSFKAMAFGVEGVVAANPSAVLKAYLTYELSRLKPVTDGKVHIRSLLLHEIVTDMALALNWDWLFRTHVDYLDKIGVKPGFETRNFCYLVKRLRDWEIDPEKTVIATPFNKIGFQMTPSREECERFLASIPGAEVIAFSALASGYLKLSEASGYIKSIPGLKGVAIGVSSESQASETFKFFRKAS